MSNKKTNDPRAEFPFFGLSQPSLLNESDVNIVTEQTLQRGLTPQVDLRKKAFEILCVAFGFLLTARRFSSAECALLSRTIGNFLFEPTQKVVILRVTVNCCMPTSVAKGRPRVTATDKVVALHPHSVTCSYS